MMKIAGYLAGRITHSGCYAGTVRLNMQPICNHGTRNQMGTRRTMMKLLSFITRRDV